MVDYESVIVGRHSAGAYTPGAFRHLLSPEHYYTWRIGGGNSALHKRGWCLAGLFGSDLTTTTGFDFGYATIQIYKGEEDIFAFIVFFGSGCFFLGIWLCLLVRMEGWMFVLFDTIVCCFAWSFF